MQLVYPMICISVCQGGTELLESLLDPLLKKTRALLDAAELTNGTNQNHSLFSSVELADIGSKPGYHSLMLPRGELGQ